MRPRVVDRIANLGPEFDDRLVHLGLDLLLEQDLATLEDFLNVRLQLARLRIDNRKLLFDAEGVGVLLLGHWSPKSLSKTWRCHQVDRAVPCPPTDGLVPWRARCLKIMAAKPLELTSPAEQTIHLVDLKRACLTNVSSPRPGDIYPSSNCPDRERVPALCGSPFPKPLPPPIRNSPDRPMPLPHPAPDCRNQSPSERHRGLRTQLCSNRSREIRLTSEPPVRLFR